MDLQTKLNLALFLAIFAALNGVFNLFAIDVVANTSQPTQAAVAASNNVPTQTLERMAQSKPNVNLLGRIKARFA